MIRVGNRLINPDHVRMLEVTRTPDGNGKGGIIRVDYADGQHFYTNGDDEFNALHPLVTGDDEEKSPARRNGK